jgi:hypothetical protein
MPVGGKELFRYYAENPFCRTFIIFPIRWQLSEYDIKFFERHNICIRYHDDFFEVATEIAKNFESMGVLLHPAMVASQIAENPKVIFCESTDPTDVMEYQFDGKRFSLTYIFVELTPLEDDLFKNIKNTAVRYLLNETDEKSLKSEVIMDNLPSYLRGRIKYLATRSFNSFSFDNGFLQKKSINKKLRHEANWFWSIPAELKEFIPSVIEDDGDGYKIQYIPAFTLSEIMMLPDFSHFDFETIMATIVKFVNLEKNYGTDMVPASEIARTLFYRKLMSRREGTLSALGIEGDTRIRLNGVELSSFDAIADEINQLLQDSTFTPSIMHGDLCFSNIVYDHILEKIYVIDPRGSVNDTESSIYGVLEYDMTKLFHSVFGLYDYIVFEKFELERIGDYEFNFEIHTNVDLVSLQNSCKNLFYENGYSKQVELALKMLPSLFLSMVPLHADNPERQLALYLRGLQLHNDYLGA